MKLSEIDFFPYVFRRTKSACATLFTFMIPISIIIHVIQLLGWLEPISSVLEPVMQIVGLPAQMALVWLTAMVVNIYGGFLALFAIYPNMPPLTSAQLTVFCVMTLIAHTFPIELMVSKKTGIRISVMFFIRFGFAVIAGILLNQLYSLTNTQQDPVSFMLAAPEHAVGWGEWALNELKNYAVITCVIFSLVSLLRILELTGAITVVNKCMASALGWLRIGPEVLTLTVLGLTFGIAYGGGLMIEETKRSQLPPRDIFYSMTLMGLFHSIIEDTILMLSMGGHWTGVLIFRPVFAFIITYLIVVFTQNIPDKTITRICMR